MSLTDKKDNTLGRGRAWSWGRDSGGVVWGSYLPGILLSCAGETEACGGEGLHLHAVSKLIVSSS